MNLYFRLLILIIKSIFIKPDHSVKKWEVNFRVMPWDCDINFHMTNSRYIALQDLARTYSIVEMGLMKSVFKEKLAPVLSAQEISYLKPIRPFKQFTLTTELVYWDEKYYYMEHRFIAGEKLYAKSMVRGVFVQNRDVIPTAEILKWAKVETASPPMSAKVEAWKTLLEEKKLAVELEK
ncbi:MAG: thioesterase [Crocinitomicaceae bacterium]|nr:thioesterase [Crocinitomicaceae bacterium]|tara:strand:+ start:1221 stop:1757 length:537 start_codon:yes stop_codon:yes gene_type:complete